jgi:hypothetical protein
VQLRQNEELQKVQKTIVEAVRTYAKSQGYDIVLADGVIYNSDAVDITAQLPVEPDGQGPGGCGTGCAGRACSEEVSSQAAHGRGVSRRASPHASA